MSFVKKIGSIDIVRVSLDEFFVWSFCNDWIDEIYSELKISDLNPNWEALAHLGFTAYKWNTRYYEYNKRCKAIERKLQAESKQAEDLLKSEIY